VLSVWGEARRDERQEPADWRSTREGFVAIKDRAIASVLPGRLRAPKVHSRQFAFGACPLVTETNATPRTGPLVPYPY
jgi:hypothetical protein